MEQSEEQTSSSESTGAEAVVDGIRKRASKARSTASKSMFNIRRKKSDTNVTGDTAESEIQDDTSLIEPMDLPVIAVDELKEAYYADLGVLVPPADPHESQPGIEEDVNVLLREMHDAIDEINRLLDGVNLSMFDGNLSDGGGDLLETASVKLPLKKRRSKPDTGIGMKTYRFNYEADEDDVDDEDTDCPGL